MTTTINASPSNGIVQTADGSGVIKLQSNGVTTNALAWVKFAGSTGTIAASYNVSSITRSGTGRYAVNFAAATADANYTPVISISPYAATSPGFSIVAGDAATAYTAPTTSSFLCGAMTYNAAGGFDPALVSVAVFGN